MLTFNKKLVNILVVDDEPSLREIIGTSLKDDGWSVETAENGRLAFELLNQKPFHIVISDIQMPEMTGVELLEAVKAKFPSIEFVIMTSNATLESAIKAIKLGAYDYLTKPFEDLTIVPNKMAQVAEKILLRQQNAELLKRLKTASQTLKRLFESTRDLNGILEEEALVSSVLESLPLLFQQEKIHSFWLAKHSGVWNLKTASPDVEFLKGAVSWATLDEVKNQASELKSFKLVTFEHQGEEVAALGFEDLNDVLSAVFIQEVKTCFQKVRFHQDILSLANRDGLTRLYNHRYFQDRLKQELSQVKRQSGQLSLILMDVDHFKNYNDSHGHPAGDKLLKQLAVLLDGENGKRDSDIIARYGGEEFVMMLPFTPYEGAKIKAERVRELVEKFAFDHAQEQPLGCVSMSIGVATVPDCGDTAAALIECADKALYAAKKQGRNRVIGFAELAKEIPAVKVEIVESKAAAPSDALEAAIESAFQAAVIPVESPAPAIETPVPVVEVPVEVADAPTSAVEAASPPPVTLDPISEPVVETVVTEAAAPVPEIPVVEDDAWVPPDPTELLSPKPTLESVLAQPDPPTPAVAAPVPAPVAVEEPAPVKAVAPDIDLGALMESIEGAFKEASDKAGAIPPGSLKEAEIPAFPEAEKKGGHGAG